MALVLDYGESNASVSGLSFRHYRGAACESKGEAGLRTGLSGADPG